MSDFLKSKIELYALIIIFVVCSIWVLDIRSLVPPDEGRYAEMAREMFVTGDWITTCLNGIKYFEKPPLHMWMSAVAYALFGIGEWQARLWNGVCGIMGVLLVGYTGRKLFGGQVGFYAASILASMLFWTGASQFNTLDIGVAATLTISLCSLLVAQQDHATASERRNWMLVCRKGKQIFLQILEALPSARMFCRKGKQICLQILEVLPSARMFCRQISPHSQESKFVYTEHWQVNLSVRSFRSSPFGVSC
ncbi:phospholipid carrier-dependent glycosyltransferase [Pseudoduganella sp. FT93W]|uniref:Phospholipid carrier-dependent glycosyltransferase n=1 Tax=Duganella fentianensis TaxID=2692177 RepID=A0A845I2C2_9BURK|nr:glycosyltransferase family 39 protein [Duganella fentianensis]MYN47724.1 phospholipid carrier-dependent glycosyltransferase [Duganella fentianensis]